MFSDIYVVQVGFASLVLHVSSIETGACEAKVTRRGLFGEVRVQWKAGYPSGQAPLGLSPGAISPSSGKTTMVFGKLNNNNVNSLIV